MLKVVSRGRRKAHILRFLVQTRRFSRTMSPHRESQHVFFTVNASGVITTESNARAGKLTLKGRKGLDTPNFLGICSRGAIPHVTPDVLSEHTEVKGVHMALEDCE
jgi:hypothetical protein